MDEENCSFASIDIEEISEGSFKHSFIIAKSFYTFIYGKLETISDLQSETNTKISVPKSRRRWSGDICILGSSRAEVISCREKIHRITEDSRQQLRYTHFLSIPLNNLEFRENFKCFREQILNDPAQEIHEIGEDIFVGNNKLHLTVGMLSLLTDEQKTEAVETLNVCVEEVVQPILKGEKEPIKFKIEGLECMNSNPAKARILYGKVVDNERLQGIVDEVFHHFVKKGLMRVERGDKRVKLHMTLMKTSKLRGKRKHPLRRSFDASKIIKDFGNYEFGETVLDTLHICECSTNPEDGSYPILTRVDLF